MYATLARLEAKGFVSSRFGDPTPERGGKARRFFRVEEEGGEALRRSMDDRVRNDARVGSAEDHLMTPTPPRAPRWLINWITPLSAEGLLGDLDEEFAARVRGQGRPSARAWYWRQVVRSLPHLLRLRAVETALAGRRTVPAGIIGCVLSLLLLYALLAFASYPNTAPLAELSPTAFLVLWVFGGSTLGAVLAAFGTPGVAPEPSPSRVAAVGLTAALLLLLGIDEALSLGQQILIAALAVTGAATGDTLARRRPLRRTT